jgi:hypothetical protein
MNPDKSLKWQRDQALFPAGPDVVSSRDSLGSAAILGSYEKLIRINSLDVRKWPLVVVTTEERKITCLL